MNASRFWTAIGTIVALGLPTACGSSSDDAGRAPESSEKPKIATGVEDAEQIDATGLSGIATPERRDASGVSAFDQLCADPIHVTGAVTDARGMASPARAREALALGRTPAPAMILPHDFANYYRVKAPPDAASDPSVVLQVKKRVFGHSSDPVYQLDLMVALVAKPLENPRPLALVLVVDTTPSMQGIALGRAKTVIDAVASGIHVGDYVAVLTTEPDAPPLFEQSIETDADRESLRNVETLLESGTEAKAPNALSRGYDIAEKQRDRAYDARVILVGDGEGELNDLDTSRIEADATPGQNPILLIAAGTGSSIGYRTRFMRTASRAGRGAYVYVDGPDTANELFVDRLDEMTRIARDDVKLDLTVDDFHVIGDVEEQIDTNSPEKSSSTKFPQYLVPGTSMTFLLRLIPCGGVLNGSANVSVVFNFADGSTVSDSKTIDELKTNTDTATLDKALAIDTYAKALRSLTIPRLSAAQTEIAAALATNPGDPELGQIAELLAKHPLLIAP